MFIAYTALNLHTTRYGERWKATTMGNGPNDAGHVVWALGECIFFFPFVFIDTDACLLHVQLLIYTLRDMEKHGRLRRWEMAQTTPDTSFGPLVSVSFFFTRFY